MPNKSFIDSYAWRSSAQETITPEALVVISMYSVFQYTPPGCPSVTLREMIGYGSFGYLYGPGPGVVVSGPNGTEVTSVAMKLHTGGHTLPWGKYVKGAPV